MALRAAPPAPAALSRIQGAPRRGWLLRTTALLPVALAGFGASAQAPTGGQVVAGQASIAQSAAQTTVTQGSDRAAIDWQQFNVGSGHTVQFRQPSAASWTLNRVVGPDPSVIAGRIQANGGVALVNQSGILFSRGAQVDVGALIASAPGITNENFMAGRMRFDVPARPGATVRNEGRITVPDRGIAVLMGARVSNAGEIHARLGRVVLGGAEAYALDLAGDGLISLDVTRAVRSDGRAIVTNEGLIEAQGGHVLLSTAAVGDLIEGLVRNTGVIRADSPAGGAPAGQVVVRGMGGGVEVTGTISAQGGAGQRGGQIAVQSDAGVRVARGAALDASGATGGGTVLVGTTGLGRNQAMARSTTVERGATLRADATVLGQGGTIAINSREATLVEGLLSARGGAQGGNGGFVELSGQGRLTLQAPVDVTAPRGALGTILIDPQRIRVTNDVAGAGDVEATPPLPGTVTANTAPDTGAVLVRPADIAAVAGNLILEADLGITVEAAVTKATGDLALNTTLGGASGVEIGAAVSLTAGGFSVNTTGAFTIAAAGTPLSNGFVSLGGSVAAGGAATVTATGAASLAGGFSGGTGATIAADTVTQTAGSIAGGTGATILTANGALSIGGAGVTGASITATSTTDAITQTAGAISSAGAVALQAAGAISQSGGTLAAGTLSVTGAGGTGTAAGSIGLNQAGNAIGAVTEARSAAALTLHTGSGAVSFATVNAVGDVALTSTGAATLTGAIAGANVTIAATTSIGQTGGSVNAGAGVGTLALRSDGAITQSGGTLAAGTLSVTGAGGTGTAAGSIGLNQAGNAIGAVTEARSAAALALHTGSGATSFATVNAVGDVALTSTGAATLTGAIAGANVTIAATTSIGQTGGSVNAGAGAGSLTLRSDGTIGQSGGGTLAAGSLTLGGITGGTRSGVVTLSEATNALALIADAQATGAMSIHTGTSDLAVTNADATGALVLATTGAASLGGTLAGAGVTVTAPTSLTQTGGSIAGGAGAVTLQSDGAVSQSGGAVTGASLSVAGTGGGNAASIQLEQAGNNFATLTTALSSGAVAIQSAAATLAIGTTTGTTIVLRGSGASTAMNLTGPITASGLGNSVALQTAGAITQDAGGIITTDSLTVAGLAGGEAASAVLNAANVVGGLSADVTGALGFTTTLALNTLNTNVDAGSVALTAPSITVLATHTLSANTGDLSLTASTAGTGTISVLGTLTGAAGQRIVLRADNLSLLTGTITNNGVSAIEVGPLSAARTMVVGVVAGGALSISALDLGKLIAATPGRLQFGETVIGASTQRGSDVTLAGLGVATNPATTQLVVAANNDIAVSAPLQTDFATATGVVLRAGGTITGAGTIVTGTDGLVIRGVGGTSTSSSGNVSLNQAGNQVALLDARSTGSLFLANQASNLIIRQARGTSVRLDVNTRTATVEAPGSGGLGISTTAADVGLRAATIVLDNDITAAAGQTITLQYAPAGPGTISGTGVLSAAGGTVALGPNGAGATVLVAAGGGAGTIAPAVIENAVAANVIVGRSTFPGGAAIEATALDVSSAINRTNAGPLSLLGGAVQLLANVTAASITAAASTGALTLTNALLTATTPLTGRITLDAATGDLTQTAGGLNAAEFAAIARAGSITLTGAANVLGSVVAGVTGPATTNGFAGNTRGLSALNAISLTVTGALTINGGVEARNGSLALTATGINQAARIYADTTATLSAGAGGIAQNAALLANAVTLISGGAITQTGGTLAPSTGASTTLTVQGTTVPGSAVPAAVTLGGANVIGSLTAAATGALSVTSTAAMTVAGASGAGVTLTGASLALTGAVNAGLNAASLTGTAGGITQTAAGLVTASSLTVAAAGGVVLDAGDAARATPAAWNQVGTLGVVTVTGAGNDFTFQTTPALSLTGAIGVADAVLIASNGTLAQAAAGGITAGSAALAGNGAVTLAGTIATGTGQTTLTSAAGAVTQTGGGITAGNFGASGTSLAFATGANTLSGTLALTATAGAISIDQAGTVTLGAIVAPTVTGNVALNGLSATAGVTVSTGGLNSTTAGISGTDLLLRTDALSLGAGAAVTATTIALGPRSGGQALLVGSGDTGTTLGVDAVTMGRLLAANAPLTIGETVIGASVVTAGNVTIGSDLTGATAKTILSAGDISLPAAITGTQVTLAATGTVIQPDAASGVGGTYAAGTSITATTTLIATAGGAIDLRAPGNSFAAIAATSTGGNVNATSSIGLTPATALGTARPGNTTLNVTGVGAATDVFLQAPSIAIGAGVTGGAGSTLTLRADDMALAGGTLAAGTVLLETLTLGVTPRPITLGAEVAGTLSLTQAELGAVTANLLVIGRANGAEASAITIDAAGIAVPATVGGLRLIGGSLSLGGDLNATGKAIDARIAGPTTRTAGVITASSLTYRGLDGVALSGAVGLAGAHLIGTVDVASLGAVTLGLDAAGGVITATQLRGASVATTVTNGGISVTGASRSDVGAFSLTGATTLTTSATITAENGLTLSGGTVTVGGALTATNGSASLTSSLGALTLNASLTTGAGGASLASGGSATLVNAPISVTGGALGFTGVGFTSTAPGTLTASGGNITLANTGAVAIGGTVNGTTGSVAITGATTLTTTAAITGQTGVTLSAGAVTTGGQVTATTGAANLTATGGVLQIGAGVTSLAGGASFASGAFATLLNGPVAVTGGDAGFTGTGFTSTAPGTITVAGGNLTLANTGTVTIGGAIQTTTGSVAITGATTLNLNATLQAANGLTLSASSITVTQAITLANGALGLITTAGNLTLNGAVTTLAGGATFTVAGDSFVNAPISVTGGALGFTGVGFTSTAPGTLTASGGNITLANTGAVAIGGTVSGTTGSVAITGATTLTTTAAITGQTGVTLSAGAVTTGGQVTATTGAANLTATGGVLQIGAGVTSLAGSASFASGAFATLLNGPVAVTGGDAGFTGTGFTSTAPGTITVAGGNLTLANTGTVTIGGAIQTTTGSVAITGATTLTTTATIAASTGLTVSSGAVTLGAAASTTAGDAVITANAGSLTVNAAVTAGAGAVTLDASRALVLNGGITSAAAGLVTLNAGTTLAPNVLDTLTQTAAGVIGGAGGTATNLVLNSRGAGATLTEANRITTLDAQAQGALAVTGDRALTVTRATSPVAVALTAPSLNLTGVVNASATGSVTLAATAGGISQTAAGIITAQLLAGSATGTIVLDTAGNAVSSTGAFVLGNSFALRSLLGLTVTSALSTPGNTVALTGASLALQGGVTAGTVTLAATAGGIGQTNAGLIVTPSLTATATAGVTLDGGDALATQTANWNQVQSLASGSGGTGGFTLRNTGNLALPGSVTAGTGTTLRLDVTGALDLAATGTLGATTGTVGVATSGPITLAGSIGAGLITLTSATGSIVQTTGSLAGGVAAQAAGAIDLQAPGNTLTTLAANATGGRLDVLSASGFTVNTAPGVPLHGGATTTITGASGSTVFLTAPALTANAAVTAATGDVQLRADGMALAAGLAATGGEVRLEQLTLGATPRAISLGVETAGALSLTTAELAGITTPRLLIGRSTGTGAGAIAGQITIAGATTVPGSVATTLRLIGSDLAVNGALSAPGTATTELQALTGSITTAGGSVTAQTLIATAPFGSVVLAGLNDVLRLTGSTSAGGSFTYRDATGFQIVAPGISAATISLTAETGAISQTAAAPLTATSLFALARTGDALLDGGSATSSGADLNQIGTLSGGGAGAASTFRLRNATGFTLSGGLANGVGGALGTLQMFTPTGSITQTAGAVQAGRVELALPTGSASLALANSIASLGTSSIAGNLTLTTGGNLALAGPVDVGSFAGGTTGTTALRSTGGSLTQGTGARLRSDLLSLDAPLGNVLLVAGGSNAAADLTQAATLIGGSAGGTFALRLGTATTVTSLLRAGSASGTPSGSLALEAPGITLGAPGQVGPLLRAGTLVLRTQAEFDAAFGGVAANITQLGGGLVAGSLSASAPGGSISLNLSENVFTSLAAGTSASGAVAGHSLRALGSIALREAGPGFTVTSPVNTGGAPLTLVAAGNLIFATTSTLPGLASLSAGQTLTIAPGALIASAGGTLTLRGTGGMTVQGTAQAPLVDAATDGVFTLAGGRLTGAGGPGNGVTLSAGSIVASGGAIDGGTVRLDARTGGASVNGTSFGVGDLLNLTAAGNIDLINPIVSADAMQARTPGAIGLSGGAYTLGRVVVFAGFSGVSTAAPVRVRTRTPGTFPGIAFDTRAPGNSFDPLTIVQADFDGRAAELQPTQVRLRNVELPGSFGPASTAAAGNVQLSLDAVASPVFLLIDGGSASGTLNTTGRVGVQGRGGTVSLTGVVIDTGGRRLEGQSTASTSDATRPALASEISRFRINDCVVSSFNCVAPSQVIVIPVTVPTPPPLVFGTGGRDPDTVSPNVAEELSFRIRGDARDCEPGAGGPGGAACSEKRAEHE